MITKNFSFTGEWSRLMIRFIEREEQREALYVLNLREIQELLDAIQTVELGDDADDDS